ncbi:septum formation initiator family protein [Jiella endophytica]|uniref:Septum formation initiator family protein n=1 Tax=Jiella endophytica TaxID=2558362 RepID=A0A4Y8RT95_9HYPH|nr:septum formation initiator family protein [Jiella endophytica]TFF20736.1 septum formation initiator family protein [Jiella endophytica]TFF27037.1 septum formation initiator family protein [Jiella endophytica]
MHTIQKRKSFFGKLIIPALTSAVLAYFVLHAKTGQYGSEAKQAFSRQLAVRNAEYAELLAERDALERRVKAMKDGTLEKDMVDENARRALNVAREDEIVILR